MAIRRVFVIWAHPLFYESVRLLLQHADIDWVGATSDRSAMQAQITNLGPDTVLLEEAADRDTSAEVLEILGASPVDMRVIQLSLAENELIIYHREQRTVGQAGDLLRLIQDR